MLHKPKSLRLLLLLFAVLLTSQVLGTATRNHASGLYLLAGLLFISGVAVLIKKLDLFTVVLNIVIAVIILTYLIKIPALWPLYLLYFFYDFLSILLCTLKLKLKI